MLGALRAVAQLLGYELLLTLSLLPLTMLAGSIDIEEIVAMQTVIGPPLHQSFLAIFLFVLLLAETQRTPFDLAEAEAELVAGYHVEFSSMFFSSFMLSEYCNIIFYATII